MKKITAITALLSGLLMLNSCLFEDPVFTEDLAKVEESLDGVWVNQDDEKDPRTAELALCAALDEERYVLHYPASKGDNAFYYEARPLERRGRTLLQLRVLASLGNGIPKPGSKTYTLVWLQPQEDGTMRLRVGGGSANLGSMKSVEARRALEDPSSDWETLFDEPITFRRLKDE